MDRLIAELLASGAVLTDGAWRTELKAAGLKPRELPDHWNLTRPDAVAAVARSYLEAGSLVILTNTHDSNRIRLRSLGFAADVGPLNESGVKISRKIANGRARVFASMGPSGRSLMDHEVTGAELRAAFSEQARILAAAGADALVVETMSDLSEARVAVEAAKATGLPVVACMTYDSGRHHDQTMFGHTPELAARGLADSGADVIGANCSRAGQSLTAVVRRLRQATDRPIWVKASVEPPGIVDGRTVYGITPEDFGNLLPSLIQAGASFVGGCCGAGPAFVRAAAASLLTG